MGRIHPPGQPVGDITSIAMRSNTALKSGAPVNRAGVVDPRSAVEATVTRPARLVDTVRQAVAVIGTGRALADHLGDDTRRAGVLHLARDVAVAGPGAVVALHQARVAHAVVGRPHARAAAGFLDDDGEDHAVVDARFGGDLLDGVPDCTLGGMG